MPERESFEVWHERCPFATTHDNCRRLYEAQHPEPAGGTSYTNPDASGTQGDVGVGLAFTSALSITAQPSLPDCPSCGRKRKMGEKVVVTGNNGTTTLWEGCWGCVVKLLTFNPDRVDELEERVSRLEGGK